MITTNRIGLGLLVAAVLAGCGSNQSDSTQPPAEPSAPLATAWPSMGGMVDSSGGTLTGATGTVFEGLTLVIPPGALSGPTNVTITQSEDTTPLPPGARRIGNQFTLGPAGTTLAMPASLTLPAEPSEVASYDSVASDMKVWRLESGAWTRSEPTATQDGLVTIALPDFGPVAPGVKITTVGLSCGGACIAPLLQPCTSGLGLCMRSFGALNPPPEDSSAGYFIDSYQLYWIAPSPSGTQVYRTVLTSGGFQNQYQAASPPFFGLTSKRANPAVSDTTDQYHLGLGTTELEAGFGGRPNFMIARPGSGALRTPSTFAWLDAVNLVRVYPSAAEAASWTPSILYGGSSVSGLHIVNPHEVGQTGQPDSGNMVTFWASYGSTFTVGQTNVLDAFGEYPTIDDWALTSAPGIVYSAGADVDKDGTVGILMRDVGAPTTTNYIALYKGTGNHGFAKTGTVALPDGALISQFQFDGLGGMWIAEASAPALWYHAPTGDYRGPYQLSSSTNPADPDYIQHLVIRLLRQTNDQDGEVVAITYGKEVMMVNYGNGSAP